MQRISKRCLLESVGSVKAKALSPEVLLLADGTQGMKLSNGEGPVSESPLVGRRY